MVSTVNSLSLSSSEHPPLGAGLEGLPQLALEGETECCEWLRFHRLWGQLPDRTLQDIARSLHLLKVAANTIVYQVDQPAIGLYLMKWGAVEIYRTSLIGRSQIRPRSAGDLFGYVTLIAKLKEGKHQTQAIAVTNSEIWFLPQARFWQLMQQHPELEHLFNTLLAQDLNAFSTRIAKEQKRIQGLQSYIQNVPKDKTIIGNSKATQKLSEQIDRAATTLKPVIFQGQAGTGKTFIAGLIHDRSGLADQPFVELDCAKFPRSPDSKSGDELNTDLLFGLVGAREGILELLGRGTLLLNNCQVLSESDLGKLIHYLKAGTILPNYDAADNLEPPTAIQSWVRLILAAPDKIELPTDLEIISIKLFNLPQRKADIPDFARYFLAQFCQAQNRPLLELDQSEMRRLISYDYPGNLAELAEILHRATIMTPIAQAVISEQALWSVQSAKNAFRVDLLTDVPWLRNILLSRWYPEGIWYVMMAFFVPVTIAGFLGPQSRDSSITLNLFWAWWWPWYLLDFRLKR